MMPLRRLKIVATQQCLQLQPSGSGSRSSRTTPCLDVRYESSKISSSSTLFAENAAANVSIDAYGIVGVFALDSDFFLVFISRREKVAQIQNAPIYVITGVECIPLESYVEARHAIEQVLKSTKPPARRADLESEDASSDGSGDRETYSEDELVDTKDRPPTPAWTPARDVIDKRGQYGRFAERWFSRNGWTSERRRSQGMSPDVGIRETIDTQQPGNGNLGPDRELADAERHDLVESGGVSRQHQGDTTPEDEDRQARSTDRRTTLLPKLLKTTKMLFECRSFYFSYEYDITRRVGTQKPNRSGLPLAQVVDSTYFWNRHLISPFIDAGYHAYVLPLLQGFVGQRNFSIDESSRNTAQENTLAANVPGDKLQNGTEFLLTLISRRSVHRQGLRYLRRGIDEKGNVANSTETEQIFSTPSWTKIHSFVQIRGSIPLYFSQSPYSFKPAPILLHSFENNRDAYALHFKNIMHQYGEVQVVSLVDKMGREAEIGKAYEEHTTKFNDNNPAGPRNISFNWFDFHDQCRGMKFENVSILLGELNESLEGFGITTITADGSTNAQQSGVVRTNCMDCLDRTNVVQAQLGAWALARSLEHLEGEKIDLQTGASTQWFNSLWADNGDAISRLYASSSALKGDFTRTRKRNYRGVLNDFGLTLSRYYNNIVNDYFSQAVIDFLLGNVNSQVFEEFEADMMSRDPAVSMDRVRTNAVETSAKVVVARDEDLLGGWTLLSPHEPNTVKRPPLEEVVLLLTHEALYIVRFDWNLEKVASFDRVDLRNIHGLIQGTYITSTVAAVHTDAATNVGFIVKYTPGKGSLARVNTRSMSSAVDPSADDSAANAKANQEDPNAENDSAPQPKIIAFKAVPSNSSLASVQGTKPALSEREQIECTCNDIKRAVLESEGGTTQDRATAFIEHRDIVSLAEARKSAGYLEQWVHSIKKLVWA